MKRLTIHLLCHIPPSPQVSGSGGVLNSQAAFFVVVVEAGEHVRYSLSVGVKGQLCGNCVVKEKFTPSHSNIEFFLLSLVYNHAYAGRLWPERRCPETHIKVEGRTVVA